MDTHAEIYNEINQLEVKKLIDKDFSCIKSIDWGNTPKEEIDRQTYFAITDE